MCFNVGGEKDSAQQREGFIPLVFFVLGIINTSKAHWHWNVESSHLSTDLQTAPPDLLLTSAALLAVIMSAHSRAAGHLRTDTRKKHCSLLSILLFSSYKHTCFSLKSRRGAEARHDSFLRTAQASSPAKREEG